MQIFLDHDYREVYINGDMLSVRPFDENRTHFYVEGTEKHLKALNELGMIGPEPDDSVESGIDHETVPAKSDIPKVGLPKAFGPHDHAAPAQYACSKHARTHRKGSSQYVTCWDAYGPFSQGQ